MIHYRCWNGHGVFVAKNRAEMIEHLRVSHNQEYLPIYEELRMMRKYPESFFTVESVPR